MMPTNESRIERLEDIVVALMAEIAELKKRIPREV
jgi:hypothetical protein